MKTIPALAALLLPIAFAACDRHQPASREMRSGAEKVAEGVGQMSRAAGEKLEAAGEKAREKIHEATAP